MSPLDPSPAASNVEQPSDGRSASPLPTTEEGPQEDGNADASPLELVVHDDSPAPPPSFSTAEMTSRAPDSSIGSPGALLPEGSDGAADRIGPPAPWLEYIPDEGGEAPPPVEFAAALLAAGEEDGVAKAGGGPDLVDDGEDAPLPPVEVAAALEAAGEEGGVAKARGELERVDDGEDAPRPFEQTTDEEAGLGGWEAKGRPELTGEDGAPKMPSQIASEYDQMDEATKKSSTRPAKKPEVPGDDIEAPPHHAQIEADPEGQVNYQSDHNNRDGAAARRRDPSAAENPENPSPAEGTVADKPPSAAGGAPEPAARRTGASDEPAPAAPQPAATRADPSSSNEPASAATVMRRVRPPPPSMMPRPPSLPREPSLPLIEATLVEEQSVYLATLVPPNQDQNQANDDGDLSSEDGDLSSEDEDLSSQDGDQPSKDGWARKNYKTMIALLLTVAVMATALRLSFGSGDNDKELAPPPSDSLDPNEMLILLAGLPSASPFAVPSDPPSELPSTAPSSKPSVVPSMLPSELPSAAPSVPPSESVLPSSSTSPSALAKNWSQRGGSIHGAAAGDRAGYSVSLSSNGTIVAVGAPDNDDCGYNAGHVRVFQWDDGKNSWSQRGGAIDGAAAWDYAGQSVSLSGDGTILAIGAIGNDDDGSFAGHVRVFQWDDGKSAWKQRGGAIDGAEAGDQAGISVSLSSDGTTLAVGAHGNDDGGNWAGQVRVFDWDDGTSAWNQLGGAIDGAAAGDQAGRAVSLSSDGTILAVGAPGNDNGGDDTGHVRAFQWDDKTNAWKQRGGSIDGGAAGNRAGISVSLSGDSTILAISALGNDGSGNFSGHVRVFQWDDGTNAWNQLGGAIDVAVAGNNAGPSMSLSSDGTIMAIGTPGNDDSGDSPGYVRVFEWIDGINAWNHRDKAIGGMAAGNEAGYSVSLFSDGTILAVGSSHGDELAGHVRVFDWA